MIPYLYVWWATESRVCWRLYCFLIWPSGWGWTTLGCGSLVLFCTFLFISGPLRLVFTYSTLLFPLYFQQGSVPWHIVFANLFPDTGGGFPWWRGVKCEVSSYPPLPATVNRTLFWLVRNFLLSSRQIEGAQVSSRSVCHYKYIHSFVQHTELNSPEAPLSPPTSLGRNRL